MPAMTYRHPSGSPLHHERLTQIDEEVQKNYFHYLEIEHETLRGVIRKEDRKKYSEFKQRIEALNEEKGFFLMDLTKVGANKRIAEECAGIGWLVVGGECLRFNTDRHGKARFAGRLVAEQDRIVRRRHEHHVRRCHEFVKLVKRPASGKRRGILRARRRAREKAGKANSLAARQKAGERAANLAGSHKRDARA